MENKISLVLNSFIDLIHRKGIPYKESSGDIIILCPNCLAKHGKHKVKLYINKETFVYHCFRCGFKGSVVTITKVLQGLGLLEGQQLFYEVMSDPEFWNIKKESGKRLISEIKTDIESDDFCASYIKLIKDTAKKCVGEIRHSLSNDINIERRIKSYIQEREVYPYELLYHKMPHFYATNIKSRLYSRFIVPTYLYTNYEARTILPVNNKYIKMPKKDFILDFVFINLCNGLYQDNPFKRKEEIIVPQLAVVEGSFDAIKLGLKGIPTISMGGFLNASKVALFLYYIGKMFKIKFKKVLYIFDKDLDDDEISKVGKDVLFLFQNNFEILIRKFNYGEYKDIGDLHNDDLVEFASHVLNTF